jgi:peptide methionine sulfoxide reductase MsrA
VEIGRGTAVVGLDLWKLELLKDADLRRPDPTDTRRKRRKRGQQFRPLLRIYEAAEKKRERDAARVEAAERKARERREQAIRKAESELHTAREAHEKLLAAIEQKRAEIEHTAREEDARWQEEEQRLQDELRNGANADSS